MNEYVYRIWDKVEECYWSTSSGKSVWNTAGFAKSAWTDKLSYYEKREMKPNIEDKRPFFDTQDRYVIHRFKVSFEFVEEVK